MEKVISATALARRLGDVLGRIRYRGESFVIERNGVAVARLVPAGPDQQAAVAESLRRWREAAEPDSEFASALERIGAADRVPGDPWGSYRHQGGGRRRTVRQRPGRRTAGRIGGLGRARLRRGAGPG